MSFQTLDGAQFVLSFRFELLDVSHNVIGHLSPFSDTAPSITNSIDRTIKRQMQGLVLPVSDAMSINTLTDRVKPWAVFGDGTQVPCGVFIFSDTTMSRRTFGSTQFASTGSQVTLTGSLLDQLSMIDQATAVGTAYPPGTPIATALEEQMQRSSALDWHIDPSTAKIRGTEWFVKPAGTSLLEVINDLAQLGSYYTLFFDNEGVGQILQVPDLSSSDIDFEYGEGGTVFADSVTESNDLLQAPNRYIVVNNSLTDQAVSGRWDIPATSPNSISNIGRIVAHQIDMQGIESNSDAAAAAKAFGQADFSTYAWATFDTLINPNHDTFNIVGWRGIKYREQSWGYTCVHDAKHNHELRRIFAEEVPV